MAPDAALQVRQAALRFALDGAPISVPMMWLAVGVLLAPAWRAQQHTTVVVLALLALANGVWRLAFLHTLQRRPALTAERMQWAERQVEANAVLGGLMWGVATLLIYPTLEPRAAGIHIALLAGTTAMTAFYMSLVGRSFPLLAVPMLLPLAALSLFDERCRSITVAVVALVFLFGAAAVARRFRAAVVTGLQRTVQMDTLNQELRQARDHAEAAARARSQFLAVMSHEIRTPLNGVLGTLDLLARSRLAAPQRHLVDVARSSGHGLLGVLNDALDHAQMDAGTLRLAPAPVSPAALVAECEALFAASAQARGLAWLVEVEAGVPDWVQTDGLRLRQVLLNLLGNALKFTERGEVRLRLAAHPGPPAGLRFEVHDTGPGIAAAQQPLLFRSFSQVDQGLARSHGGAGLGLAISQRLVQALGGEIGVRSSPGQGSCFYFTVPARVVAPPVAAAPKAQPARLATPASTASAVSNASAPVPIAAPAAEAAEAVPAPLAFDTAEGPLPSLRGRVLVAEDNEVNRLITAGMLEALGLQVVEANDGHQALARLHEGGLDLALMDMQMPGLDGAEATHRWRQHEAASGAARLPIVALTANALPEDQAAARAAGMDAHLAKPCRLDDLAQMLARWLPAA